MSVPELRRRLSRILACLAGLAWAGGAASTQDLTDVGARAAFTYNFGKYAEWGGGGGDLIICTVTYDDTLAAAFSRLDGRRIADRSVATARPARPADVGSCHVLFLSRTVERRHLESFVAAARGRPILTVSDAPGFLDMGGMIELVPRDDRLAFEIDLGTVRRHGISLGAQVLRLANRVRE